MVVRASSLLAIVADLAAYYAFSERLPAVSVWWDVALLALVVIPATFEFAKLEEVLVLTSPSLQVNAAIEAAERARATPVPTPEPTFVPTPGPTPKPGSAAAATATAAARRATPAAGRTASYTPTSRPAPHPTPKR